MRPGQSSQLSATLERLINNTWDNTDQGNGSEDLQGMMSNQKVEFEDTEFSRTGDWIKSNKNEKID